MLCKCCEIVGGVSGLLSPAADHKGWWGAGRLPAGAGSLNTHGGTRGISEEKCSVLKIYTGPVLQASVETA